MRLLLLCLLFGATSIALAPGPQSAAVATPKHQCRIYDPNPSHIWNRVHATLLIREDLPGANQDAESLDALFWFTTKY